MTYQLKPLYLALLFILAAVLLLPVSPALAAADCPAILAQYSDDDAGLERLIDPQLTTQAEIDQAISAISELQICLAALGENLTGEQQMLQTLAEYFLIFAGGQAPEGAPGRLELVDLATSDDPAVVRLREEAEIPAPPGYVFIRYYPSRESMPDLVRYPFDDPNVAGVTYLSRYIAILEEEKPSWAEQALQDQVIPKTFSHELVHAYLNSALGPVRHDDLPRWYHEGLAVYFSGSGEEHSIVTPNFSLTQTTTEEYKSFELIFKYLADRLGEEELYTTLRQTIATHDITPLYQAAGLSDERWLIATAENWQAQRLRSRYLLLLVISITLGAGLFLLAPEYECACGHTGHRRDFPGGVCTECGRHLPGAGSLRRWKPLRLYSDCEVCGRRYWRWQFGALHFHTWRVRAWTSLPLPSEETDDLAALPADPDSSESPIRMLWVHRICETCAANSQLAYQQYATRMADEIAAERERLLPLVHTWLSQAPLQPYNSFARQDSLNYLHALELCVQAALAARYPDWVDSQATFEIVLGDEGNADTPTGYAHVLRRLGSYQGRPVTLLGSVGRLSNAIVLIVWEVNPDNEL